MKKETLKILGKLGVINDTQIIRYPHTTITRGSSIRCFFDISKHENEKFKDFGIFSVARLESLVNQIKPSSIDFLPDGRLELKNEENQVTIQFPTDSIEMLEVQTGKTLSYNILDKTLDDSISEKVASCTLTKDSLSMIMSMANSLETLKDVTFMSEDSEIKVVLSEDGVSGATNYSQILDGVSLHDFTITIKKDALAFLPKGNYKLEVRRGIEDNNRLRCIFFSEDIEGLTIVMSAKSKL